MKRFKIFAAVVGFFMLLLVIKPGLYMQAVADGLKLFAISVLPAMFPFFFFSKLLTSMDVAKSLSYFTKKPVSKLYNAPSVGGYILVMSMLSGYPVGAKLVSDCYERGLCTKEDAKALISFTSTSGPLFVLGTVGAGMLQNYTAGVIILVTHYLGALINGLLYRKRAAASHTGSLFISTDYDNILSDAINSSIVSVMAVGGYIAIFNMVIAALKDINVIGALSAALQKIFIPYNLSEGVISGIIEVTRGALVLSASGQSLKIIAPIIAALVSFGGLSVTLQSLTFLSKCKIKAAYYLLTKTTQAAITGILAAAVCLIAF